MCTKDEPEYINRDAQMGSHTLILLNKGELK